MFTVLLPVDTPVLVRSAVVDGVIASPPFVNLLLFSGASTSSKPSVNRNYQPVLICCNGQLNAQQLSGIRHSGEYSATTKSFETQVATDKATFKLVCIEYNLNYLAVAKVT